jgi:hypothetical protein
MTVAGVKGCFFGGQEILSERIGLKKRLVVIVEL